MRLREATIILIGAALWTSSSARAADADAGRRIAERWCAACHVVSSEQTTGMEGAPPFSELAARIDFRSRPLADVLSGPHPVMPNMQLGRTDAADLTAYIQSQRR